jgi:hypothetical protein
MIENFIIMIESDVENFFFKKLILIDIKIIIHI